MHNNTPQNDQEAVELGLYLAITADTEEKSEAALELARNLAERLNYAEVQTAKRNVAAFVEQERAPKPPL
jgi:enoyl-CoA hydratase/carnithine racemase